MATSLKTITQQAEDIRSEIKESLDMEAPIVHDMFCAIEDSLEKIISEVSDLQDMYVEAEDERKELEQTVSELRDELRELEDRADDFRNFEEEYGDIITIEGISGKIHYSCESNIDKELMQTLELVLKSYRPQTALQVLKSLAETLKVDKLIPTK